jgi:hypothetical protein
MTDQDNLDPRKLMAARLPDMEPLLRRRVVTIATNVAWDLIETTRNRERAWRSRQPGGHHIEHRIRKAELRIERRLLAIMERELKARHGQKRWRRREILQLAADYRRLKKGQGLSGITTG